MRKKILAWNGGGVSNFSQIVKDGYAYNREQAKSEPSRITEIEDIIEAEIDELREEFRTMLEMASSSM